MKKERKYIALRIKIAASFFLTVLLFTIVAGVIRTGMFIHSKNQDMQLGAITLEKKKTERRIKEIEKTLQMLDEMPDDSRARQDSAKLMKELVELRRKR